MTSTVSSINSDLANQRSSKTSLLDHYGALRRNKQRLQRSHGDLPQKGDQLPILPASKLGREHRKLCASAPELVRNETVYFDGIKIRVLEEVCHGSSATVYKAESPLSTPKNLSRTSSVSSMSDTSSSLSITEMNCEEEDFLCDDHVAIKVCKNHSHEDKKDIAAEMDILLSEHQSPHIVKCFGIITGELDTYDQVDDNNVGFVLEYHKLGNLNEYLIKNDQMLDRELIISFAEDIIKALHFVHNSLNVVHRDIRSPNFLVTDELKLLLCDFGSARKNTKHNRETTFKIVKTNPRWTAPELYDDDAPDISYTFASDIYSIGIVLWEMFNYYVSGKYGVPFGLTKHPFKITMDIVEGMRPDISDDKFPIEFKDILSQAWNQDPSERPNTSELLEMICKLSVCLDRV